MRGRGGLRRTDFEFIVCVCVFQGVLWGVVGQYPQSGPAEQHPLCGLRVLQVAGGGGQGENGHVEVGVKRKRVGRETANKICGYFKAIFGSLYPIFGL